MWLVSAEDSPQNVLFRLDITDSSALLGTWERDAEFDPTMTAEQVCDAFAIRVANSLRSRCVCPIRVNNFAGGQLMPGLTAGQVRVSVMGNFDTPGLTIEMTEPAALA